MYRFESNFEFCADLEEKGIEAVANAPDWKIWRLNLSLPLWNIRTKRRFIFSFEQIKYSRHVLLLLNSHNRFDSDYQPKEKDYLCIYCHFPSPLTYQYNPEGNWQATGYRNIALNSQMEIIKKGKIL